jgi:1,4-alpha-glucan branching enzyme
VEEISPDSAAWERSGGINKQKASFMNTSVFDRSDERYSARKMAKPVNFFLAAPEARVVSLIGDFNEWNPAANPMARRLDGAWFAQVLLTHGHHQYQFLVDGTAQMDPQAMGMAHNEKGEKVSLVAVS